MLRFAFLFLALLALPVKAATVTNLYQTQVVLPDTDKQSEKQAQAQGLEQVLIKVSGQSAIANNEVIRKAMTNSRPYISQFGYGNLNGERTLELTFNGGQIRDLLTKANATLWNEQRPTILVWLVEESNREREILWDQSGNSLQPQMNLAADKRGLPVIMPIGDFDDVTALSIPDLWGGFVQPIAEASQRYNPDAVLVVRARKQADDNVNLSWQLFPQKPDQIVNSQKAPAEGRVSGTAAKATTDMMNKIADELAAKYAVQLGGASDGAFAIQVGNVKTTEDFFTLERMLTNLTSVASVNANRLQGDSVQFDVKLLSSEAAFRRELGQDSRISQKAIDIQDTIEFEDNIATGVIDPVAADIAKNNMLIKPIDPQASSEQSDQLPADPNAIDVSATIQPEQAQVEVYYWKS
ncbi:DUF2066 domain-containing protein [Photobacterium frigidiphilum]|uniref:DUF2066 domain-containing protein n=1 Tax=Photobacterium frigidiphilum TaxID=264736 RepID=A0A2T3J6L0_9GAMM|nr:DUF2066 domain-containing protein [Photobacterium frigidiphilum]PSU43814.1 DUF2066 domain-containing protein [Photobacterium frigidiphilum]